MFFGQTSNWLKLVRQVTDNGHASYPHIAAQYTDATHAIRMHCGQEAQVQLHTQLYLTKSEDFEMLDQFLSYFGLPRNGYSIVNTYQPYGYSASATVTSMVEQQPLLTPTTNR